MSSEGQLAQEAEVPRKALGFHSCGSGGHMRIWTTWVLSIPQGVFSRIQGASFIFKNWEIKSWLLCNTMGVVLLFIFRGTGAECRGNAGDGVSTSEIQRNLGHCFRKWGHPLECSSTDQSPDCKSGLPEKPTCLLLGSPSASNCYGVYEESTILSESFYPQSTAW